MPDEPKSRLIARVVRDVLRQGPFESLSALTPEVKLRCLRLRIAVDNDALNAAYGVIDTNTPLVEELPKAAPVMELPAPGPTIGAAEARELLDRIYTGCRR